MKKPAEDDLKKLLRRTNNLLITLIVLMSVFFFHHSWASYAARYQTRLGFNLVLQDLHDIDKVIRSMRVY